MSAKALYVDVEIRRYAAIVDGYVIIRCRLRYAANINITLRYALRHTPCCRYIAITLRHDITLMMKAIIRHMITLRAIGCRAITLLATLLRAIRHCCRRRVTPHY